MVEHTDILYVRHTYAYKRSKGFHRYRSSEIAQLTTISCINISSPCNFVKYYYRISPKAEYIYFGDFFSNHKHVAKLMSPLNVTVGNGKTV